ncbi:MAG TPA: Ku protein [Bryobacteraceae bacterium]|nr:Ku protein [Bryobacteraceae bacterium]
MASSVWRGYITFGLISIPVRLFRAARPERVKLREVYAVPDQLESEPQDGLGAGPVPAVPSRSGPVIAERAGGARLEPAEQPVAIAPVRRVATNEAGALVPPSHVSKAHEVEKGRFVALAREELNALVPKTSTTMELVEFVNLASVDPIYFETSYYIRPESAGERPYALLYCSLKQTGLVGVAQIAMHRREHIVIVRSGKSGLIAHTMYFSSEVRADQEFQADESLVSPKELELANTLVQAIAAEFTPEKFRDAYREQLETLIAAKAAAQPLAAAHMPPPRKPAADIMEALRKSLAGMKKPAASEAASGQPRVRAKKSL